MTESSEYDKLERRVRQQSRIRRRQVDDVEVLAVIAAGLFCGIALVLAWL